MISKNYTGAQNVSDSVLVTPRSGLAARSGATIVNTLPTVAPTSSM